MNEYILIKPQELSMLIKTSIQEALQEFSPITTYTAEQSPQNSEVLTAHQVCQMLDINKTTLSRRVRDKKIPQYGMGRRAYYLKNEVLQSLKRTN